MTGSRTRQQAGFTLIELMISLVIASLAVGFIFRIYATTSVAYRTQSQIAEMYQGLRAAKQIITKDLRQAGYYADNINTLVNTGFTGHHDDSTGAVTPAGVYMYSPVQVINSSTGPDELHIVYADDTCSTRVSTGGAAWDTAVGATSATVDTNTCGFAVGDVVIAVRTADGSTTSAKTTKKGWGCALKLTSVAATSLGFGSTGTPYNSTTNAQCNHIAQDWNDGFTRIMKLSVKGYRIKPSDARGVLQSSVTAGAANDWQDLAFGFVDMQFAIQVYEAGTSTAATDEDQIDIDAAGNKSPVYEWFSGSNLTTLDLATRVPVQIHVSLLARTVAEVDGVVPAATPSLLGSSTRPNFNQVGDHDAVTIANEAATSMYKGNYIYRMLSTTVDLRNLGIGKSI